MRIAAIILGLLLIPHAAWAAFPVVSPLKLDLGENRREAALVIHNNDSCPVDYAIQLKAAGEPMVMDTGAPQLRYAPRATTLQPGQVQTVRLLLDSGLALDAPAKLHHALVVTKLNHCSDPSGRVRYAVSVPVLSPAP